MTEQRSFEEVLAEDAAVAERFGYRYEWHKDGACRLSATVLPEFVNAAGFAHGGLYFTMCDTASAYAVRSLGVYGVTTDANIHYARGAKSGEAIHAIAQVVSRSKRLASIRAEVRRTEDDQLLTHGTYTFTLLG